MEASTRLPSDPRSAGEARRFATRTLGEWGLLELDDTVSLLVSELVTNAVLHARSGILVVLRRENGGVRIEVHDASRAPARPQRFGVDAGTGRGLVLVEALAANWGVTATGDGKYVWCFVAVPVEAR